MIDINKFQHNFTNDFFDLMETSYILSKEDPKLSSINISTMTAVCDIDCMINLEKLTKFFTSPSYPLCSIKKAKSNKECTYTKRGKQKKSFYNQTTITYKTHTTKSIKVFSNGKLQITGLTSVIEALDTIQIVIYILKESNNSIISGKPEITNMKHFSIEMINSNFNYLKEIDLKKLKNLMKSMYLDVTYDPDTYPGINAKINGVSVFIFGTGNVVITGSKSLKSTTNTLRYVSKLLCENKQTHLKNGKGLKKTKRIILKKNGYDENLYNACSIKTEFKVLD